MIKILSTKRDAESCFASSRRTNSKRSMMRVHVFSLARFRRYLLLIRFFAPSIVGGYIDLLFHLFTHKREYVIRADLDGISAGERAALCVLITMAPGTIAFQHGNSSVLIHSICYAKDGTIDLLRRYATTIGSKLRLTTVRELRDVDASVSMTHEN